MGASFLFGLPKWRKSALIFQKLRGCAFCRNLTYFRRRGPDVIVSRHGIVG